MKAKDCTLFFALNREKKIATELPGFTFWEEVQGAFRCGILLPDGTPANGIGRCEPETFNDRAGRSGYRII